MGGTAASSRQAVSALRARLAGVPDASVEPIAEPLIADSVAYLDSSEALRSIAADPYWPKWNSPWWRMLALFEIGEARRIPARTLAAMIDRMNAMPVKTFPFRDADWRGHDRWRDSTCHCAIGCLSQVLHASGIDPLAALPWFRPWPHVYQMTDGGLSCDSDAYLVAGECPSSMVGTIALFEALQLGTWDAEQEQFLERAAQFLIGRRLMTGSSSVHNAEERDAAAGWLAPCFPRFYFYDVLRGLVALVGWAIRSGRSIPLDAVAGVVDHLIIAFPDGVIRVRREGLATAPRTIDWVTNGADHGQWQRGQPTSRFALLDAMTAIDAPSATLTRQWADARRDLLTLIDGGRLVERAA